jgi:diketogulonate reductase-like aldo/keto reductase
MNIPIISHKNKQLFPLGIGTWGIGGFATANAENYDAKQIDALAYMLSNGMNYVSTTLWYAEGRSVELLKKAIDVSGVSKDTLAINLSIYPFSADTVVKAQDEVLRFLEIMDIPQVHSIQLLYSTFMTFGVDTGMKFYEEMLSQKKTAFVAVTNHNLPFLEKLADTFTDKLFSHEVCVNFEVRENISNGTVPFAKEHDILNVIYQPLRRNRTEKRNWPLLVELAQKYGKTQNQIVLNWLMSQGYLPITKSETIAHIDEYLGATAFKLESVDIALINAFSPPSYKQPPVFYGLEGEGVRIDQLSNVFDEEYDKA